MLRFGVLFTPLLIRMLWIVATVMAFLMVSAMDGDAMGSGLLDARLVFGLLFWLGWLLGGGGRGGGLLFSVQR